jgi:protein-tyrosine phosphatase
MEMNFKLDDNVLFGNWTAPIELIGEYKTIINVGHKFARSKETYWDNLKKIPYEVFYVRLAEKDHRRIDIDYFRAFESTVLQAKAMGKLPILCHCQLGAHRGPTSAIAASWILGGKRKDHLEELIARTTELRSRYARTIDFEYRQSMMDIMKAESI